MAAYAALVSLMNDLELIPNHPTHSFTFDNKQISSLSQTVHFLVDFLETYNSHGCPREEAVEVLESQIASAAHVAHDVIESHVVDQIHARSTLLGRKPGSYFLLDLQKAIVNMDFVKKETMQFKAKNRLKAEGPTTYSAPPTSSERPTSGKNVMVGFDAVLLRLMEMMTGEPSCSQRVIPIVGMGGMGKTTIAINVYGHLLIQHHFDVRLWATISQVYDVEAILTQLLFGERKSTIDGNVSELGQALHKKLWGRRYLVVLDDMWSLEAWNDVSMFLPDNGNGSCVIVTTRLSNLTAHLRSPPFEMNFLDDDQSWQLFCKNAFGEEEGCPDEIEKIGKKIVKRCGGLPLSIVVTGGHLKRSSRAVEYWEKVSNSLNPISSLDEDDRCLKIISLSYENLPACLKPCFLYMGVFPEDRWINASELIKYWITEGFVKAKEGLSLEEVAEDYLKDLIDRNLILVFGRGWNGKVLCCGIHEMVRDLCLKVAEKEKFLYVLQDTSTQDLKSKHCIVIPMEISSLERHKTRDLELPPLLRSLICQEERLLDQMPVDLRLLRLFANVDPDKHLIPKNMHIPTPNFQQVNLRYLAFSVPFVELPYSIPSSISLSWNMQTLIVKCDFSDRISAPNEIWEMPQLRHLELPGFCLPELVFGERSKQGECIILQNLHTLVGVENLRLTDEVCKRMPNLKKLSISYYHFPDEYEASSYYCLHNLGRFSKLESLQCSFVFDSKWRDVALTFVFPTSLEELCLLNCYWEDLTKMIKSLPHLGFLELSWAHGLEWDLAEEEFPHLKILKIFSSIDLIYWNASSSNFPVLENLHFWGLSELIEIPSDIGEIPTLRRIELYNCSVSLAVSVMRVVVEQESLGNQDLQLEVDFFEMEEVERFRKLVQQEGLTTDSLRLSYRYKKIKAF